MLPSEAIRGDTLWPLLVDTELTLDHDLTSQRGLVPAEDDAQVLEQWLEAADAVAHTLLLLAGARVAMGGAMSTKDGGSLRHELGMALAADTPPDASLCV
jgi:hypothetical protein